MLEDNYLTVVHSNIRVCANDTTEGQSQTGAREFISLDGPSQGNGNVVKGGRESRAETGVLYF